MFNYSNAGDDERGLLANTYRPDNETRFLSCGEQVGLQHPSRHGFRRARFEFCGDFPDIQAALPGEPSGEPDPNPAPSKPSPRRIKNLKRRICDLIAEVYFGRNPGSVVHNTSSFYCPAWSASCARSRPKNAANDISLKFVRGYSATIFLRTLRELVITLSPKRPVLHGIEKRGFRCLYCVFRCGVQSDSTQAV